MPYTSDDWWDEPTPNSRVKTQIVSKYADAWAGIIAPHLRPYEMLSYVDLYAGRGRYRNGESGTALDVLSRISNGQAARHLRNRVRVIMNDKDPAYTAELRSAISKSDALNIVGNDPVVTTERVDEPLVRKTLQELSGPAFWFIDPWGTKE